jgi:hypothetical protein
MVCFADAHRKVDFIGRALILNIPFERALFLASCPHTTPSGRVEIPYDESVLINEAFRLGIGFEDTAEMMGMTYEQLASYGIPFEKQSRLPKPPGFGGYNLLTQDQYETNNSKPKKRKRKKTQSSNV